MFKMEASSKMLITRKRQEEEEIQSNERSPFVEVDLIFDETEVNPEMSWIEPDRRDKE